MLIEWTWLRLTRLVWLSAEMRVPIRVRLSAVMIVTFSGGVEHVSHRASSSESEATGW